MQCNRIAKQLIILIVLMLVSITAAYGVMAAEQPEEPVYEEEEVVITATRTQQESSQAPGKTEVITKAAIEDSGAATVAEVFSHTGTVISTYGGQSAAATVQLGGTNANQTLVLVNGIPANTGCAGQVDLSYFPTIGVSRIEVVHGPLSALYGTNALGGVVNIFTDLTSDTPNHQVSLTSGSNKYGQLGLLLKEKQYGIALGGMITDGHRSYSDTKNRFLMAQYDLAQNEREQLNMNLMYRAKKNQVPGSTSWPVRGDQFEENIDFNLLGKRSLDTMEIEYKVFNQSFELEYESEGEAKSKHQVDSWGTDIAGLFYIANHQVLVGMMVRQDDFNSTANGVHKWKNGALFFQDIWELDEKLKLISGLRWDTGSKYSSPVCPRININYSYSDNLSLKLGYGKVFRAPTLSELYWPETQYEAGNPDLKPETGGRYEITGEWRRDTHYLSLQIFESKINNGIDWTETDKWRPGNVEKTRIVGSELSWQNQWSAFLTSGIKYSWINKKAWEDTTASYSKDQSYYGKNRINSNLAFCRDAWLVNLDWTYIMNRNNNMPDYDIVNVTVKYQVNSKLNYNLTMSNITDEAYEIHRGYPMPGREFYLSANYTF